jgi:hypothetical protein
MSKDEARDIEERLKEIKLKPVPPGLKDKVLEAAREHKEESAWTTPLLRWCLAGCAALLAVVFITDGLVSHAQQNRLQALFDGSRTTPRLTEDGSRMLAEVLGELASEKLLVQSEMAAEKQTKAEQIRREEILKELLLEDFDGNESKKNIR